MTFKGCDSAVITFDSGKDVALKVKEAMDSLGLKPLAILYTQKKDDRFLNWHSGLRELMSMLFQSVDAIVGVMPLGVMTRIIAPNLKSKKTDPGVIVVDHQGRFVISLISEHRIADSLSERIASGIGGEPVITTLGRNPIKSRKRVAIGIGSNRGIDKESVIRAIKKGLDLASLGLEEVECIATIDLKSKERGIIEAAEDLDLKILFISKESIKSIKSDSVSPHAQKALGVDGVCEQAAIAAYNREGRLILKKSILEPGITIAIVEGR